MHRVVEEIVSANAWRGGELARFKVGALGVDEAFWCRLCIPMIYAHWEGFVVSSLKLLIEHLNSLNLPALEIPTKLVVVGLGDAYKSLSGKQSFGQRVEFTDKFRGLLSLAVKFKTKVDTRSNLRGDVLSELCNMYGFDFERFQDVSSDIDRLVNIRNSIAHGENSVVPTRDNIFRYIEAVTEAMDLLLDEIEKFLATEAFKIKLAS